MKSPRFTLRRLLWAMTFTAVFMTLAMHVKFAVIYCPPEWIQVSVSWDDPINAYSFWFYEGKFGCGEQVVP